MRIYGNRLTYDEPRPSSLTELQWLAAPAWTGPNMCTRKYATNVGSERDGEGGYVVSGSAIQDDSGVICRMNALWTLF